MSLKEMRTKRSIIIPIYSGENQGLGRGQHFSAFWNISSSLGNGGCTTSESQSKV